METSCFRVQDQNPWSDTDSALSPLLNILNLAKRTGYIKKEVEQNGKLKTFSSSLALMAVLKEITSIQKDLHQIDLDIQKRMLDKETSDITHLDIREERVKKIQSLNEHMQSIIDSKAQLKTRLQQPFVGDFIKLEAQYHRYAAELFPQIAPLLADLNTHLENITWTKSLTFKDGKLESLMGEISNTLAGMQTTFHLLCQMRNSMSHFYSQDFEET